MEGEDLTEVILRVKGEWIWSAPRKKQGTMMRGGGRR